MSDLYVALLTIFGTVASVGGVVLYVFNGTRKLIREMHETQKEIQKTQIEMQKTQIEIHETQKEIQKTHKEMHETIREMHETQKEIVELSKKGFGDLSRDVEEIKSAIKK